MSYDDFIKNFDEVQMCHIEPDLAGTNLAADAVIMITVLLTKPQLGT